MWFHDWCLVFWLILWFVVCWMLDLTDVYSSEYGVYCLLSGLLLFLLLIRFLFDWFYVYWFDVFYLFCGVLYDMFLGFVVDRLSLFLGLIYVLLNFVFFSLTNLFELLFYRCHAGLTVDLFLWFVASDCLFVLFWFVFNVLVYDYMILSFYIVITVCL